MRNLTVNSKSRNYVWTLHLPADAQSDSSTATSWVTESFKPQIASWAEHKFSVFQLEQCPDSDRFHLQGYSELKKPTRFTWLSAHWALMASAHFEVRRGTRQQAIDYCKKEPTRVSGPWEVGEDHGQGHRSDLSNVAQEILEGRTLVDIAMAHPSSFIRYHRGIERCLGLIGPRPRVDWQIEVIVLWGDPGSGKSYTARHQYPNAYEWMPQRGQQIWWDGYQGEDTILIDEFANNFPYHYALRLLDTPGMRAETKGGTLILYPRRIVITSMASPEKWWPNQETDRYALYRRITWCYRFHGTWRERTSTCVVDFFPYPYESDPQNRARPRLWCPQPVQEESTALSNALDSSASQSSPEIRLNFDSSWEAPSAIVEEHTGSTQEFEFIDLTI